MKTKKQFSMTALAIVAIVALALAFITCDNGDEETHTHTWGAWQVTTPATVTADGEQTRTCATCGAKETQSIAKLPPPHESTITAFGKTATVTGDASIPKADFDEAVERLQTALSVLNADSGLPQNVIGALTRMMSRNITILIGDAAPADVNGALTMGVGYNSAPIENALYSIANSGGFADPPTPCPCPEGTTHEPNQKCCEGTDCNCQIEKTYTITLKDGNLVFTVEYNALATDEEPAYLAYLKTRLEAIVSSTAAQNIASVNNLINLGGNFTIIVEYANTLYEGIKWDTETRTFTIHNDWIATASDTDLSLSMMRTTFNEVKAE